MRASRLPDDGDNRQCTVRWLPTLVVGASILAYVVFFSWFSILKHDRFLTGGLDLGNFDQAVWNTLHGRILRLTNLPGLVSRLSLHFEPILILLSPIYLLWSDVRALLLIQTMALAAGAIPVYLLARTRLGHWSAAGFVVVYLLYPALEAANMFDFHANALAVPFLAAAFYCAELRWYRALAVWATLGMACREDIVLMFSMMGIYIVWVHQERKGWWLLSVSLAVFGLTTLVIMPVSTKEGLLRHAARYTFLRDAVHNAVQTSPCGIAAVVSDVLSEPDRIRYMTHLTAPVLVTPLLSPGSLLPATPIIGLNLLSSWNCTYALDRFHYSAPIVPFIAFSAILGVERLVTWLMKQRSIPRTFTLAVLMAGILTTSVTYHRRFGHTPISKRFAVPKAEKRFAAASEMFGLIPSDARVSAEGSLNPHLTQRETIYLFPNLEHPTAGPADYVALDQMGNIFPAKPEQYDALVTDMMSSGDYRILFDEDGYLLLKRRKATP